VINGKKYEIAFRRWLMKISPSKKFVEQLKNQNLEGYRYFFEQFFNSSQECWETYHKVWHIDHIVPLYSFNESEVWLAWSQENLRPLDKNKNRNKGGSLREAMHEINKRLSLHPQNQNLIQLKEKLDHLLPNEPINGLTFF